MELLLYTNRALTESEIATIEKMSRIKVEKTDDTDFHRNCPPSFPMFKSFRPNYVISDGNDDDDFEGEYQLGCKLQEAIPAIVHF